MQPLRGCPWGTCFAKIDDWVVSQVFPGLHLIRDRRHATSLLCLAESSKEQQMPSYQHPKAKALSDEAAKLYDDARKHERKAKKLNEDAAKLIKQADQIERDAG